MDDSHLQHTSEFHINPNTEPLNWIVSAFMLMMDVFLVFICFSLINPVKKFLKASNKNPKCTVILSTITSFAFCVSAILVTISTVLILLSSDLNHVNIVDDIFIKSGLSLYLFSQTLLILAFNIRIDETFKGSHIQYPKRCIRSLYISSFLFFVFCIFFVISLILEQWEMFASFSIIWILLYSCLSIVLCVLFVRKIELLVIYCSGEYQLDSALLHLVIKHAILVPICIGTSLLCLVLFVLIDYVIAPGEWVTTAVIWIVLDCTMSSIGIYLLFAWNNKYYDRFCGSLHYICETRDVLQLAKSHTKRVTKDREKRDQSRTEASNTQTATRSKTKTSHERDVASVKSSLGPLRVETTTDSRPNQTASAQTQPVMTLMESLKGRLSNKKSIGKNKVLGTHLMHDDAVALSEGSDEQRLSLHLSAIDRERIKRIQAAEQEELQLD